MAIEKVPSVHNELSPQTVLAKLESTWQIYNMQQVNLESGVTKDNLLQRTADMLTFYRMDEKFYSSPENLFFALAFQQELMLAQDDPNKTSQMSTAFDLLTATDETKNYSYSELVRERYTQAFVRKSVEPATRRQVVMKTLFESNGAVFHTIDENTNINGINIWGLAREILNKFGITDDWQKDVQLAILDPEVVGFDILAWGDYDRIVVREDVDRQILMHELMHAIFGFNLSNGFKGFFLRGVLEAMTEIMTEEPTGYSRQRDVIYEIFNHIEDSRRFRTCLEEAYLYNDVAKIDMWKMLVEVYGLRAVVYFGLLDPGTPKFMESLLGREHANVFIPADQVVEFFNHPKAL